MEERDITCNKSINFGQPSLDGTRLTVYDIVVKIYYEDNVEIILEDADITMGEAQNSIEYCMNLKCQKDNNRSHYCYGCLLRTLEERNNFNRNDYTELEIGEGKKIVVSKDGYITFLGNMDELEEEEFGKVTWLLAGDLYKKFFKGSVS